MNTKLFILILLSVSIYENSFAQSVVYVTEMSDKRLVSYRDSLKAWQEYEKGKQAHRIILDAAKDLAEYNRLSDELGYRDTEIPASEDKKFMWDSNKKIYFRYELLTCFHARIGDLACIYKHIIPKPHVMVLYKPLKRYKTTTVIKIDANKDTSVVVTKTQIPLKASSR